MANATRRNDGLWVPRVHLGDPNDPPAFPTEAEALECHSQTFRRIADLAGQLDCAKSRAAIAEILKDRGLIRRIPADRRSDLYDDAGIMARHYLIANDEVCDVTVDELVGLEIFV